MKHSKTFLLAALVLGAFPAASLIAGPLGTAFTYQGQLAQNNQPAPNGIYQMTYWLHAAASGDNPLASNTVSSIPVTNGLFAVDVDFGANRFTGDERWLAITVATNGSSTFTLLQPRSRLAPTPNALYASTAGTATNVVSGAIQISQLGTVGAPSPGQVLGYNGNSLIWQAPGDGGVWSLNGNNAYYTAGSVGIGTASPSSLYNLDVLGSGRVRGDLEVNSGGNLSLGGATSEEGLGVFFMSGWAPAGIQPPTRFAVKRDGSVGIGTSQPRGKLHIASGGLAVTGASSPYTGSGPGVFMETGFGAGLLFAYDYAANNSLPLLLNPTTDGKVGIGTTQPKGKLHVANGGLAVTGASSPYTGSGPGVFMETGFGAGLLFAYDYAANASMPLLLNPTSGGNVGIGTSAPQAQLDVAGVTRTCTLSIYGGCDIAEPFPIKENGIEKGSVVIIDDEHPGRLKLSMRAYDTQVAGIVSGANGINPGISLTQEGTLDQGHNVALTGRVYVKADALHGAIKPGDLLTTSDTPGHAMKVSDHTKSQGAILGKAMSALKEGTGLVLVLVTLQ